MNPCCPFHFSQIAQEPHARLLKIPPPKDLTRDEFETCLVSLGGIFRATAGGGSHGRFVSVKAQPCFSAPAVRIPIPRSMPSPSGCQSTE